MPQVPVSPTLAIQLIYFFLVPKNMMGLWKGGDVSFLSRLLPFWSSLTKACWNAGILDGLTRFVHASSSFLSKNALLLLAHVVKSVAQFCPAELWRGARLFFSRGIIAKVEDDDFLNAAFLCLAAMDVNWVMTQKRKDNSDIVLENVISLLSRSSVLRENKIGSERLDAALANAFFLMDRIQEERLKEVKLLYRNEEEMDIEESDEEEEIEEEMFSMFFSLSSSWPKLAEQVLMVQLERKEGLCTSFQALARLVCLVLEKGVKEESERLKIVASFAPLSSIALDSFGKEQPTHVFHFTLHLALFAILFPHTSNVIYDVDRLKGLLYLCKSFVFEEWQEGKRERPVSRTAKSFCSHLYRLKYSASFYVFQTLMLFSSHRSWFDKEEFVISFPTSPNNPTLGNTLNHHHEKYAPFLPQNQRIRHFQDLVETERELFNNPQDKISIVVSRDCVLQDAFKQLSSYTTQLKKKLEVEFISNGVKEPGFGVGVSPIIIKSAFSYTFQIGYQRIIARSDEGRIKS